MKPNKFTQFLSNNSPMLALTGSGAGYVGTVFLTIRATKKAIKKVEQLKAEQPKRIFTKKEIFKATYKYYIPVLSMGIASMVLLCYAGASYEKRNRAAIAACALSENAFREFKEAVEEKLSDDQLKEVYSKVGEKTIAAVDTPVPAEPSGGPDGKYWFIEPFGKHEFRSTKEEVLDKIAAIRMRLSGDPWNFCSIEEYCYDLGVEAPNLNEKVGWNTDIGLPRVDFGYGHLRNGTPAFTLIHYVQPRWVD